SSAVHVTLNEVPPEPSVHAHRQLQVHQRALCMRENDVRFQVSCASSAAKCVWLTSTAVRQTPLTATLLPIFNSRVSCDAATVRRRTPSRSTMSVTQPTSSIKPVNMATEYHPCTVIHPLGRGRIAQGEFWLERWSRVESKESLNELLRHCRD